MRKMSGDQITKFIRSSWTRFGQAGMVGCVWTRPHAAASGFPRLPGQSGPNSCSSYTLFANSLQHAFFHAPVHQPSQTALMAPGGLPVPLDLRACAPQKRGLNPFFFKRGAPFSFPYVETYQDRIWRELNEPDTKRSLKCAIP